MISGRLRSRPAALPFASVEPCLDGIDHHGRERDFLIERVLANALVKLDREVNRGLAETFAVLGANARLFLRSAAEGTGGLHDLQLDEATRHSCGGIGSRDERHLERLAGDRVVHPNLPAELRNDLPRGGIEQADQLHDPVG
jgi:hypothetical protein